MWLGDGFLSSFSKDNNANFLVKKKCNEAFRGDYTRTNFKSNLILVAVLRTISFFPDVSQALSNISIKVKFCTAWSASCQTQVREFFCSC